MIRYSLIIPHHDIPDLLVRCLQSIPVRPDLQVIVVDDNSQDCIVERLHQIQSRFLHVEFVFLRPGKGGGGARNEGLSVAKGDYVLFADADDFFMPCLSQALDDVLKYNTDIVFFNAIAVDTDTYSYAYRCWHVNRWIRMHKKNPAKAEFELKFAFGEPWCKVIKREIIEKNRILFDETRIHNDTRFSYLVGFYAKSVFVDQRALYCVTDRKGSVSKILTPERLIARAKVFADANYFFRKNGVNRFDERAIRPLVKFLLKLDMQHFFSCRRVLKESGMGSFEIFYKMLIYPLFAIHKALISASQYKIRLFG